jgi:hypothetical protein
MLHQELDSIATDTTSEALEYFLAGGYGEGWRFLIVKRTESKVVGSSFLQFYEIAYNLHNINAGKDLLYSVLRNQFLSAGLTANLLIFEV